MTFPRWIAGPMDYHLGGFRAVPRAQFKPRNVAPNVLGTRCHMLAMYVCFDNPAPMVADYPALACEWNGNSVNARMVVARLSTISAVGDAAWQSGTQNR